jgi:hypothetical protein
VFIALHRSACCLGARAEGITSGSTYLNELGHVGEVLSRLKIRIVHRQMLKVHKLFQEGLVLRGQGLNFEFVEDEVAKLRGLERLSTSLGSSSSPSAIIFWTWSLIEDIY